MERSHKIFADRLWFGLLCFFIILFWFFGFLSVGGVRKAQGCVKTGIFAERVPTVEKGIGGVRGACGEWKLCKYSGIIAPLKESNKYHTNNNTRRIQ